MKDIFGSRFFLLMKPDKVFLVMVSLIISAQLFALGVLSYLGTFSRYLADDYCESASLKSGSVISAVLDRYLSGDSNRYSNLLFVGLSEMLGEDSVQILPFLMIFLWVLGTIWIVHELRQLTGIRWPTMMDVFLAVSVVFFSAWQAPNRYQTFLWRSGMATHFAPLVFIVLLFGFIFSRVNSRTKPSLWNSLFVFLASFMIGGFSEPPAIFLIVMIFMLILFTWRLDTHVKWRSLLPLLLSSLAGMLLALAIMFFSPTMNTLGPTSFVDSIVATLRTFRFTINFMDDTIRTQPLPSLISFLTTFVIFFVFVIKSENQFVFFRHKRSIWLALVFVPLIQYVLIAASFAPSAYGESYPAERAQFLGRIIMTAAVLLEGTLLGVLCASTKIFLPRRQLLFMLGSLTLFALVFYPLRAGFSLLAYVPDYRQWASTWELREAEIYSSIAEGELALVVRWMPTKDGVKEIDATTKHWVNRCAARYYEVDSIRSVQTGN